MSFFSRSTIRAWLHPEHRLSCVGTRWAAIIRELERRGEGRHEAGVFLLGREVRGRREVLDVVYYDELDPRAYASGVCVLYAPAFSRLWALCRERQLTVVGDVHTHLGSPRQSEADRTNPMVARGGHIAIIVPNLARGPVRPRDCGAYVYLGSHNWREYLGHAAGRILYVGAWS